MRTMMGTCLVFAALFVAAPACGSSSSGSNADALVGEWAGKCGTEDQSGGQAGGDVDATLRFTQDGKYSQSIAGPDGGTVNGTYTVAGQAIDLTTEGDSLKADYAVENGVLTTKTQDSSTGTPVTSTCTLRRSSGG